MSLNEDARQFLKRLEKAGVELYLWKGTVRVDPKVSLGKTTEADLLRFRPWIKTELTQRADHERSLPGVSHKWLLKKGYRTPNRIATGYMACGPATWLQRCVRAATLFSESVAERALWIVIEQEWVGPIVRNGNGTLIASYVKLPDGFGQAAPEGVEVEIAAACLACLVPGPNQEDAEAVVKDE